MVKNPSQHHMDTEIAMDMDMEAVDMEAADTTLRLKMDTTPMTHPMTLTPTRSPTM
jgi:hypothetical protein